MPRIVFEHNDSSVVIRHNDISISGKMEDAAWAMADNCLKVGKTNNNTNWRYCAILEVTLRENVYDLTLLDPKAMDAATWEIFKKDVEKICNNLTVFM